jgi:exopolysaccharide production protein ExoZ
MNRVLSVELLRGLAAISVMGFHFSISHPLPIFGAIFANGHIGVDLFFLISGFVIYVSTERDRHPGRFLIRRFFRIVPLAWVCTLCAYLVMPPPRQPNLVADLFFFPSDTISGPLFAPIYALHILPVLWSMSYEVLFYAVFAAVLYLGRARGLLTTTILVGLVAVGQGTPFITLDAQSFSLVGRPLFANPMLLYFPVGMLFGWLSMRGSLALWMSSRIMLAALALAIWWTLPVTYGFTRIGIIAIPLFLLMPTIKEGRMGKIAAALGSISYAIYLIHQMIEPAIGNFPTTVAQMYVASPGFAQVTILTIATLGSAVVAHLLIERLFIGIGRALYQRIAAAPAVPGEPAQRVLAATTPFIVVAEGAPPKNGDVSPARQLPVPKVAAGVNEVEMLLPKPAGMM